jgi:hypothetical protein
MDWTQTLVWIGVALAVLIGLLAWYALYKGRPRPGDHVFLASRWTKGNRIFPSQVIITPTSVTMFQPQWIGKIEESLHLAHVASIKIDTNLMFSSVLIETSGGQDPVVLHGHTKGDAVEMKRVIEEYQTGFYKRTS